MLIKVTQEDIDNGSVSAGFCPIALALDRTLGDPAPVIAVYENMLEIDGEFYAIPAAASEFVRRFDAGESVDPFEFDLDLSPVKVTLCIDEPGILHYRICSERNEGGDLGPV